MKKGIILVGVVSVLSLASCKQNYTCTCDGPGVKDPEVTSWKLKQEDAKANCDALNAEFEEDNGSCTLTPG
ncbi:MAG: hypothetical protein ABJG68_13670 [Crocinitomicaceae bacterium]